jgi:hypothetical protein
MTFILCKINISCLSPGLYKIYLDSINVDRIEGQLDLNIPDAKDSSISRDFVQEHRDFVDRYEKDCTDGRLGDNFYAPVPDPEQVHYPPPNPEERARIRSEYTQDIRNHLRILNDAFERAFNLGDLREFRLKLNPHLVNDSFIKLLVSTDDYRIEELPLEKIDWIQKRLGCGAVVTVVFASS